MLPIMPTYLTLEIRTCPVCKREFNPRQVNAVYCNIGCRGKAAYAKARTTRDQLREQHKGAPIRMNPQVASLDAFAAMIAMNPVNEIMAFGGVIPEWTPPPGVRWEQGIDGTMVLSKMGGDFDIMEEMRKGNVQILEP